MPCSPTLPLLALVILRLARVAYKSLPGRTGYDSMSFAISVSKPDLRREMEADMKQ